MGLIYGVLRGDRGTYYPELSIMRDNPMELHSWLSFCISHKNSTNGLPDEVVHRGPIEFHLRAICTPCLRTYIAWTFTCTWDQSAIYEMIQIRVRVILKQMLHGICY